MAPNNARDLGLRIAELESEIARLRADWKTCDRCGTCYDATRDGCVYCEAEVIQAEVLRLRAALRPFGEMAQFLKDEVKDERAWQPYVKAKHWRAAREALKGGK